MGAEIPCHAVNTTPPGGPPSAAAPQPGDPRRNLPPEPRARVASCNTSGLAEQELAGGGRPALPRGRASREGITFATGSLLKDSEKRTAACARPTPGLPTGPPARPPRHGPRRAKATGSPRHRPKTAEKFLAGGTGTGACLLGRGLPNSVAAVGIRCPSDHGRAVLPSHSRPQFPHL